jgi:sugar lactone lactonase YvrE
MLVQTHLSVSLLVEICMTRVEVLILSAGLGLFAAQGTSAQVAIPASGVINTLAGDGLLGYAGDGGQAASAELRSPTRVAIDSSGNIYIADYANNRIRMVKSATGVISTLAGTGTAGYSGDGGQASAAAISSPYGIAVDTSGNVYFSDLGNSRIRKVNTTGVISTIAGNGTAGYAGDGGAATSAELDNPTGIAVDASGNIYIADSGNFRIRKVTVASGNTIGTIAGTGTSGYNGDGIAATSAEIMSVFGVSVDSSGNVYLADHGASRIRKITLSTGLISTVGGNGTASYAGDGGLATSAEINDPSGLCVDAAGNIFFADTMNGRIRKVTISTGDIATVAGNGTVSFSGDGGVATSAAFSDPLDVALDSSGNLYIADYGNNRVRGVGAVKASPVITLADSPSSATYGSVTSAFTATVPSGAATVTFSNGQGWSSGAVPVTGSTATTSISNAGWTAGAYTITASYSGNSAEKAATAAAVFTVNKATPVLSWATPAAISYGTALSATQLDATSSAAGALVYTPVAGSVPAAGTDTLSVAFTPTDTVDYTTASKSVSLVVGKVAPTITWAAPATITYGTALSATQLDATASVAGTFAYSPAVGSVPSAGTDTLSVTFTPTNTTDYSSATKTVSLVVNKATPVITWATPAAISYGTALSATQLDATASVAGTLVYTPATGAILGGGAQTLSVAFTPTNTTDYATVTKTVPITVNKSASTITVTSSSSSAVYATAVTFTATVTSGAAGSTVTFLNGTATLGTAIVSGTTASLVVSGLVVGSHAITASWPGNANLAAATSAAITQTITQATPVLTWATPAAILYGTALSATQLNASAGSVAGTLVYSPASGTIPAVGTVTLSVTFTPTDTTDYKSATKTVALAVNQAASTISVASSNLSSVYGASVTFTATLPAGASGNVTFLNGATSLGSSPIGGTTATVTTAALTAGTHAITASWPGNANLTAATSSAITQTVAKATPVVTWATPAAIVYGTALSATQLNATASIAGSFVYSPASGTSLHAGSQTLSVAFTPTDTTDYNTPAAKTVTLTVNKAVPVLTWTAPSPIVSGTALSATQLDATANVAGTFAYTPASGTKPAAGSDALSVTFTPTDATDYTTATKSTTLTVLTPPVITLAQASGTPGSSLTINGANFGTSQASVSVTFSGTAAIVTGWSATQIIVTVPATLGAGIYSVVVNVDGVAASPPANFQVDPKITGTSISSGPVTVGVMIQGAGFGAMQGDSTVMVGNTAATVVTWNDTNILIQVPQVAVAATTITVKVVSGESTIPSNAWAFNVTVPFGCG